MSNFIQRTRHPDTKEFEDAEWLDDYYSFDFKIVFDKGRHIQEGSYDSDYDAVSDEEMLENLLNGEAVQLALEQIDFNS